MLQFVLNASYIAGRKFTLYLFIRRELFSAIQFHVNVKEIYGSLFPLSIDPAARNCEIQSNKTALSPRNAPWLLYGTKVGVQPYRNIRLQFEYYAVQFACQRRTQSIILLGADARRQWLKVVTRTRGITHMWFVYPTSNANERLPADPYPNIKRAKRRESGLASVASE